MTQSIKLLHMSQYWYKLLNKIIEKINERKEDKSTIDKNVK